MRKLPFWQASEHSIKILPLELRIMRDGASIVAATKPFEMRNLKTTLPSGMSISAMLDAIGCTLPGISYSVSIDGKIVHPDFWGARTIEDGNLVCVRSCYGSSGGEDGEKNVAATVLGLALAVGVMMIPGAGVVAAIARVGAGYVGSLAINAIAPPPEQDKFEEAKTDVTLSNQTSPWGAVPYITGTDKIFPPHATLWWKSPKDDRIYMLFCLGPGPLSIDTSSMQFGSRLCSSIDDFEYDTYSGKADDEVTRAYAPPLQWTNVLDIELDDGGAYYEPMTLTPDDINHVVVEFRFPDGIYGEPEPVPSGYPNQYPPNTRWECRIRVNYLLRKVGEEQYYEGLLFDLYRNTPLADSYAKKIVLSGNFGWPNEPGQWYLSFKFESTVASDDGVFLRPVYVYSIESQKYVDPILDDNVATISMSFPSDQNEDSSGPVEYNKFNVQASRILPTWNGVSWETYAEAEASDSTSSNPAAIMRDLMAGPGNAKRYDFHVDGGDSVLDDESLGAFYERCATEGYNFNGTFSKSGTLFQSLKTVAAIGRASPGANRGMFGAVLDQDAEGDTPGQAFCVRNSADFSAAKIFPPEIHGLKMQFRNSAADYAQDEVIAYAEEYEPPNGLPATIFEKMEAFGCTTADEARDYGRFHIEAVRLRPEIYKLNVDKEGLLCTRGDVVSVSHDVIQVGSGSGRICDIELNGSSQTIAVWIDNTLYAPEGNLGIRIRLNDMTFITREVEHHSIHSEYGETQVRFDSDPIIGTQPQELDMIQFGVLDSESAMMVVNKIEPSADMRFQLTLVDHAPGVHTPGVWEEYNSQVTVPPNIEFLPPAVPEIIYIQSDETVLERGLDGSLVSRIVLTLQFVTGSSGAHGQPVHRPPVHAVQLGYRVHDEEHPRPWTIVTFDGEVRHVFARDVIDGEEYDLRVRSISQFNVPSDYSAIAQHVVVGQTSRPPAPTQLEIERDILRWTYWSPPIDHMGFEVRMHTGSLRSWESSVPLHQGIISYTNFNLPVLPAGIYTFYVKAVDARWPEPDSYSEDAAYLVREFSAIDLMNVDTSLSATSYESAWILYVFSITGGSISGSEIVADSTGTVDVFWDEDQNAPFWPSDQSSTFWPTTTGPYSEMTVILSATILWQDGQDDIPWFCHIEWTGQAGAIQVYYQSTESFGTLPREDAWIPWPGRISGFDINYLSGPGTSIVVLCFKLVFSGGDEQGKLQNFGHWVTYPDVEERVIGHTITNAVTPEIISETKTYSVVQVLLVQITAGTAIGYRILSKTPGSLQVELLDSNNASVTGTCDVYIKGFVELQT